MRECRRRFPPSFRDESANAAFGPGWRRLALAVTGVAIYANSLSAPFIFDDLSWISHRRVGDLWPLTSSLDVGRPVLLSSLALNYAIGGMDPAGFHVFNLVVHLLAALTLYGIARRTFRSSVLSERYSDSADGLAFAVAWIWLAHPLATQAVTYVVQRAESMMALFYLLTLYCVIRSDESNRSAVWSVVAVVFCAIGMQTKEVMVGAPIIVLLYDRTFLAGSFAAALRSRAALYIGLAATWSLLWLNLNSSALSGGAAWAGFGLPDLSAIEYARSQPGVILHYLRLCIWPHPLVFDYGWPVTDDLGRIFASTAVVGALGFATLWALWRLPPLGFLGAVFFCVLAPTSSVLAIIDLAFEHRMYLPLTAVVAAGVVATNAVLTRAAAPVWVGTALLFVVIVSLSTATILRNRDYRSVESLWRTVVEAAPQNGRGHTNLAAALVELNRHEEALVHLRRVSELTPNDPAAYVNLAIALLILEQFEEADVHLKRALEIRPSLAGALSGFNQLVREHHKREAGRR
jgi:tetratricopeptide (TPR) repeat protein